ncbi:hypothetical protein J471_2156, partial [Acinetobacter baumannii 1032359]
MLILYFLSSLYFSLTSQPQDLSMQLHLSNFFQNKSLANH